MSKSCLRSLPETQIAALTAERDQLAAEKAELKDRLLRALADFEISAGAPSATAPNTCSSRPWKWCAT